tara:strand:- start:917 stop:1081 length:165 start_codon:yes stop_codon:yes gene_type:complete
MENKMKFDLKNILIGIIIGILISVLVGLLLNDVHINVRVGDIDKTNNKVDLINN